MGRIIGIDLGTSTSEAAVYDDGNPILIKNELGEDIIPSIVSLYQDTFIAGTRAKERLLLYPEDTVAEMKRMMGSGKTLILGGKHYTPEQISSYILSYMKAYAEDWLGEPVDRAVITVPAYFTNEQRNATIEAGKLAGLTVERIINEPTAAALCYGIEHLEEEQHILVYDLGGGTFDVTLLEMFSGVLEVKASSGNNQLGGKDFDERIVNHLLRKVRDNYGVDLSSDVYAMAKLKEEAINCKIALSSKKSYEIVLPMIAEQKGRPISLQETITREMFEEMIKDLVLSTREQIDLVLRDGTINKKEIDVILLVGGSTKIPFVRIFVEELLVQAPKELVNPDLAVALGAAVQTGILTKEIDPESGILLTDVAPYSLGLSVMADMNGIDMPGVFDIVIKRNTTIPASVTKRYTTSADNQRSAEVEVYQGEYPLAEQNYFLGNFVIGDIPRGKAKTQSLDVTFSYDADGLLVVTAKIVSTGQEASVEVDLTHVQPDITPDITLWEECAKAKKYKPIIRKAERMLKRIEYVDRLLHEALDAAIYDLKEAIVLDETDEELHLLTEDVLNLIDEVKNS